MNVTLILLTLGAALIGYVIWKKYSVQMKPYIHLLNFIAHVFLGVIIYKALGIFPLPLVITFLLSEIYLFYFYRKRNDIKMN
ncbi:hypothetical protein ERX35_011150 [Macrococcus equipercicus]|uniref:Uncharacterized protein n=1 Tax=Macrococcus equipercicus TaxID=69967 RepID=A0ABQ6R633_9STAP|nr:hypothetical protein [Macrococcus equipercicus]KAA1035416.1 hypothetical protein ERX35_011150 [Macrococcus equipercicus]